MCSGTAATPIDRCRARSRPPRFLYQLAIDGLQADFQALKSIGAGSSLPIPATPLVGRDGEVAELTAQLRSPARPEVVIRCRGFGLCSAGSSASVCWVAAEHLEVLPLAVGTETVRSRKRAPATG